MISNEEKFNNALNLMIPTADTILQQSKPS